MIACLGWGSLVWKLEGLLVEKLRSDLPVPPWTRCAEGKVGDWQCDGPPVKVEFLRQSKDKRLTLVLHASAAPVPSLWARMTVDNLNTAVKDLKKRAPRQNLWVQLVLRRLVHFVGEKERE